MNFKLLYLKKEFKCRSVLIASLIKSKKIKNVLLTLSKPSGEIARFIMNLRCSDMVAEGQW